MNQTLANRHPTLLSGVFAFSLVALSLFALPVVAATPETSLGQQRNLFQSARDALRSGHMQQFNKASQQLRGYPLYPYLEFWHIKRELTKTDPATVHHFLDQYGDTPLANRLRIDWLIHLAKRQQWQRFLAFYTPDMGVKLECYQRRALYKTGDKQAAFKGLKKLWLTADSLPRACDPLFSAWRKTGKLDHTLVWRRIELIMLGGDIYEARALEHYLNRSQRHWAKLWRMVHQQPEKMLTDRRLKQDTPITRTILAHGVRRLARLNPLMGAEAWDKLIMEYSFSEEEYDRTETYIALALARAKAPEAMRWLTSLADSENPAVREWRVLTAINQDKWDEALHWLDQLTPDEQEKERWLYWRARALEATGKPERARLVYTKAAKNRNYYGFMAADHIGSPYEFEQRPLHFPEAEMDSARNLPTIQRVRELYALGDIINARREWFYLIQHADRSTLLKAAKLAHEWGWHDRAIFTLYRADYMDDVEIRFPLAHRDLVIDNAKSQEIDPSWAYAIIRQESAFASDARSPVGALGLMQIMPSTGRVIARDLSTRLRSSNQLLDVNTNIRFGISYLRKVLNRFDDNTALATAAYNAGSQRVKSWLPTDDNMVTDLWVENIPFRETRHYVKQVLAFATIYDERLTRPAVSIKERMPTIPAAATPAAPL